MRIIELLERPLRPGTRVYIIQDPEFGGPFQETFGATVQSSKRVEGLMPAAAKKSKFVYFVTFDSPQFDCDGDGPYSASEVLAAYVVPA